MIPSGQLKVGDTAPYFSLQGVDGRVISLEGLQQEKKNVLLVFLRHLG